MDCIADYEFVRPLGAGPHGEYYLARAPSRLSLDAEHVAVKVWSAGTSRKSVHNAVAELKRFAAAASVESEYLVRLFDAGQQADVFFYSMEFFPLGSLALPSQPLTRVESLIAVAHASRAAHALHEAGIVHRNIKPANILRTEAGTAKLSDLGLAHVVTPGLTITSVGRVDPVEFLDPGILAGRERPSRASDIWSLGVTLHRALTGAGVYGELPDDDPLYAIRTVVGKRPMLDPSLEASDRALVDACLAVEPRDRFPTALALAERIEELVAG
jgi:eukaryotic-like serine/threonine-protein kinase